MGDETRVCSRCGDEKPADEFYEKTGCKKCHSKYSKSHYRANRAAYLAKAIRNRSRSVAVLRAWVLDYLRTHSCIDCPEADPVALTFDHRNPPKKLNNVSNMVGQGWSLNTLKKEVAKCDVRCCNCHAKRTAVQRKYYRAKI